MANRSAEQRAIDKAYWKETGKFHAPKGWRPKTFDGSPWVYKSPEITPEQQELIDADSKDAGKSVYDAGYYIDHGFYPDDPRAKKSAFTETPKLSPENQVILDSYNGKQSITPNTTIDSTYDPSILDILDIVPGSNERTLKDWTGQDKIINNKPSVQDAIVAATTPKVTAQGKSAFTPYYAPLSKAHYATVDPLNLAGNRNGMNPLNIFDGNPIFSSNRFSGGEVPNSGGRILVDKKFNDVLNGF